MKNIIVTCFFVLMQLGILVHAQTNTTTDIYQKGQDGYACFRIPAIVKSKAGTLLAFAEARKNSCSDTGNIDLVVKRSEDGGKTWSRIITVWDDGDNVCGNPSPIVDQETGRIILVSCWNVGEYMFFIPITMAKVGLPPKKSHHLSNTLIGLGTQQAPVMGSNYKVKRIKDG